MEKEFLNSLQQRLRQRRAHFLREFRRSEDGLDVIAEERESELEEHAQEEQTARLLTRLDGQTLQAVKEIDAALQKILNCAYGSGASPVTMTPSPSEPLARQKMCSGRVVPETARAPLSSDRQSHGDIQQGCECFHD